jgi:ABC-type glycerol-3-phosphate transport system substrate-binding protein
LKQKFQFLTFMTDREIENFLSIVGAVATGTSISPDEILQEIEKESCKNLAYC